MSSSLYSISFSTFVYTSYWVSQILHSHAVFLFYELAEWQWFWWWRWREASSQAPPPAPQAPWWGLRWLIVSSKLISPIFLLSYWNKGLRVFGLCYILAAVCFFCMMAHFVILSFTVEQNSCVFCIKWCRHCVELYKSFYVCILFSFFFFLRTRGKLRKDNNAPETYYSIWLCEQ